MVPYADSARLLRREAPHALSLMILAADSTVIPVSARLCDIHSEVLCLPSLRFLASEVPVLPTRVDDAAVPPRDVAH